MRACVLTSWMEPLSVPPMPLEIISIVLARATTHGNISDHRPCIALPRHVRFICTVQSVN